MKGIDYITETNTYCAFLPFNTPIRKIGFCPDSTHISLFTEGREGVKWELGFACFRGWEMGFCALGLGFMKKKKQ